MSTQEAARSSSRVQSVDRAIDVLQHLARHGWSGVTDVGNAIGVHKSTAFRLLSSLEARGLVEQHVESGKYHLGFGLIHLARAVNVGPDLTGKAQPICRQLAEDTGETVTLAVLEGDEVITIDQIMPDAAVVSRSWLGRRSPLHATSHGKVFLAWLPESRRQSIVKSRHESFTPNTIVDPAMLAEELAAVRARGWSSVTDELEEGLSAVAAPVRAADGTVIAAISVSGPTYRIDDVRRAEHVELMLAACQDISTRFGWAADARTR